MNITDYLHPESIIPELSATDKNSAIAELVGRLADVYPDVDRDEVLRVVLEREHLGSTGIGDGIAIPHGKLRQAASTMLVFGRKQAGIDFSALDGRPVYLFFLLVAPDNAVGDHLKILARISRLMKDGAVRTMLRQAPDENALLSIMSTQDARN